MSSVTIATKVDEESNLVQEFEEYKKRKSMNSKSEAVRTLLREGLENEAEDNDADKSASSQDAQPRATVPLQDAMSEAGLLNRRFIAYALFALVAQDIYQLVIDVGTFFNSTGAANWAFSISASIVLLLFIFDYVFKPLASSVKDMIDTDSAASAAGE
jgi:hypothetical protein